MRVVVIGGSGQVGRAVTAVLRERGHDAVPVSRSSGVDAYTGAGLPEVLSGADAVLDATRTPSLEERAATDYLRTSSVTLLAAERAAGVRLHVPVSIVGMQRVPELGYYRAKLVQEATIADGGVPFTMLRATQFLEFLPTVLAGNVHDGVARLPASLVQPIAVADLAEILADVLTAPPAYGIVEAAGPEPLALDEIGRRLLPGVRVETDPGARPWFGAALPERALLPAPGARLGRTTLADWLTRRAATGSAPPTSAP
jgi:uncharacterized protein YbjT (DUF2867 family)